MDDVLLGDVIANQRLEPAVMAKLAPMTHRPAAAQAHR
jgi:hypothetical protein